MIFVRPGRKRGADTMSRPCEKVVSRTLKSVPPITKLHTFPSVVTLHHSAAPGARSVHRVSHSSSSPPPRSGAPAKSASGPSSSGGTSSASTPAISACTCTCADVLVAFGFHRRKLWCTGCPKGRKSGVHTQKHVPENHFCPPLVPPRHRAA